MNLGTHSCDLRGLSPVTLGARARARAGASFKFHESVDPLGLFHRGSTSYCPKPASLCGLELLAVSVHSCSLFSLTDRGKITGKHHTLITTIQGFPGCHGVQLSNS